MSESNQLLLTGVIIFLIATPLTFILSVFNGNWVGVLFSLSLSLLEIVVLFIIGKGKLSAIVIIVYLIGGPILLFSESGGGVLIGQILTVIDGIIILIIVLAIIFAKPTPSAKNTTSPSSKPKPVTRNKIAKGPLPPAISSPPPSFVNEPVMTTMRNPPLVLSEQPGVNEIEADEWPEESVLRSKYGYNVAKGTSMGMRRQSLAHAINGEGAAYVVHHLSSMIALNKRRQDHKMDGAIARWLEDVDWVIQYQPGQPDIQIPQQNQPTSRMTLEREDNTKPPSMKTIFTCVRCGNDFIRSSPHAVYCRRCSSEVDKQPATGNPFSKNSYSHKTDFDFDHYD